MLEENVLEDLLKGCGQKNQEDFKKLYTGFAPKMLAVLLRMLNDRQVAEEALQDAMLSVWDAADKFDKTRAKASTWMIAIARYRALDQLRKENRYHEVLEHDKVNILEALSYHVDESDAVCEMSMKRLQHCLDQLNNNASKSIQLAYLDGYTNKEIGKPLVY